MAGTLPSPFMDKVADILGVDCAKVRSRKTELIAHVQSIIAEGPDLSA